MKISRNDLLQLFHACKFKKNAHTIWAKKSNKFLVKKAIKFAAFAKEGDAVDPKSKVLATLASNIVSAVDKDDDLSIVTVEPKSKKKAKPEKETKKKKKKRKEVEEDEDEEEADDEEEEEADDDDDDDDDEPRTKKGKNMKKKKKNRDKEEKAEKKKKKKGKEKPEKKKKKRESSVERDDYYGVVVGSANHKAIMALKVGKGMTMSELKKKIKSSVGFYQLFNKLVEEGKLKRNKDGEYMRKK